MAPNLTYEKFLSPLSAVSSRTESCLMSQKFITPKRQSQIRFSFFSTIADARVSAHVDKKFGNEPMHFVKTTRPIEAQKNTILGRVYPAPHWGEGKGERGNTAACLGFMAARDPITKRRGAAVASIFFRQ